ncbi:THAP domain [Popillia japonica]|uniref:THAP domain n=1 Tax=Popillia japonica TaxID=7064 RepID=A0AAW1L863_POPJA
MGFKCCVESCRRTNKDVTLHSYPKEPKHFSKWLSLIGRTTLLAKGMDHFCSTLVNGFRLLEEPLYWLKLYHNRSCLKVDCVHSQYLPRLDESIQGTEEVNKRDHISPSIKNWQITLERLKYLWTHLSRKGFDY